MGAVRPNHWEQCLLGEAKVQAGGTTDQCHAGMPAPEGATGWLMSGAEGGGVREIWGADIKEAILVKVCSFSLIKILV